MRRRRARAVALAAVSLISAGCALHVRPPLEFRAAGPVERGRYLYENLMDCDGCHQRAGAPMPPEKDIPGRLVAPNLTPDFETGLGRWTDGEKIRAIREGISRNGRPLFPAMPYRNYRRLTDADAAALVAYMNTFEPRRNALPRSRVNFVVRSYVRSWPRPAEAAPMEPGEYLATLASCVDCHSPLRRGRPIPSRLFAGGRIFDGGARSPNITPDPESGIGRWSEQDFVNRFRLWRPGGKPSPMPWSGLSRLDEADLRAIYRYLRAQKPVRTRVH